MGVEKFLAQWLVGDQIVRVQPLGCELPVDQQHMRCLVGCARERFVYQRRVVDHFAAAGAGIGGDDQRGFGIVDAGRQVGRREAAEHDRVNRAEPRACQHGEQRLGDHRQIEQHDVAALHA